MSDGVEKNLSGRVTRKKKALFVKISHLYKSNKELGLWRPDLILFLFFFSNMWDNAKAVFILFCFI